MNVDIDISWKRFEEFLNFAKMHDEHNIKISAERSEKLDAND